MKPVVEDSIWAGAVFAGAIILAIIVRAILSRLADKFDRTDGDLLDDLFRSLRTPSTVLVLVAGLYFALMRIQAWNKYVADHQKFFAATISLIVVIAASSAINLALVWYGRKVSADAGAPAQLGLLRKLAILAVWLIGIIQILGQLGVNISAVLASLGIAGLAVGLALQDTIANLFAGFYLVADRSVRSGDYIKLDSGEEGFVENVGWRNTRIRLWANNIVLVPNAKLIQSIITNMNLPSHSLSVYTSCGVSYDSDLYEVERVTLEVVDDTLNKFPGADRTYDPIVRFNEFGDSNINFVVIFRAVDVGAQYLLQHEFVKALHKRFTQENIEINYPVRKLVWDKHAEIPQPLSRMDDASKS